MEEDDKKRRIDAYLLSVHQCMLVKAASINEESMKQIRALERRSAIAPLLVKAADDVGRVHSDEECNDGSG